MRRFSFVALAAAAALAGCPLPQPLPDYPAGTVTPPRILVDEIPGNVEVIRYVPAGCATPPVYPLTATLYDANTIEVVEARWFVNYDPTDRNYYLPLQDQPIAPDPDPLTFTRVVPPSGDAGEPRPFLFYPYDYPPPKGTPPAVGPPYPGANILRVVELVVSNGFDPDALESTDSPLPRRATLASPTLFETQVYRWVFLSVPEAAGTCAPGTVGCVKCP